MKKLIQKFFRWILTDDLKEIKMHSQRFVHLLVKHSETAAEVETMRSVLEKTLLNAQAINGEQEEKIKELNILLKTKK